MSTRALGDADERDQIERMHELMDEHGLDGQVRWLEMQVWRRTSPASSTARRRPRGAFVQPALFEAFGLTVIEAMVSGLPTFATCFGGPLEIIEDGVSGFHIDPNHGDRASGRMAEFLARWNFITDIERHETRRYLEMLYALMYRPLADGVGGGD
jgi:sucrose synthase